MQLRQLITFFNVASNYLNTHRESTKLTYALARMQKRVQKFINEFDEKMEDFRLPLALEDEKTKELLLDERSNFKFSRDGTQKIIEKRRELLKEEVSIEPYNATSIPNDLPDDFRVEFEGFVLKEQEEPTPSA